MRGYVPRLAREIIFGIGMNQLADFCAERVPRSIENQHLRNAVGSLSAGVLAGYLSHVPHVLSTHKLLKPHLTYTELFKVEWSKHVDKLPEWLPPESKVGVAKLRAVIFPTACLRRSMQICGTFVIINGITYSLRNKDWY